MYPKQNYLYHIKMAILKTENVNLLALYLLYRRLLGHEEFQDGRERIQREEIHKIIRSLLFIFRSLLLRPLIHHTIQFQCF